MARVALVDQPLDILPLDPIAATDTNGGESARIYPIPDAV
jgi:hypothetical protein